MGYVEWNWKYFQIVIPSILLAGYGNPAANEKEKCVESLIDRA